MAHDSTGRVEINLDHYNVGFVQIKDEPASLLGSGTFVQFGSVFGILTADHVLNCLLRYEHVGLFYFPVRSEQSQKLPMSTSEIDYVRLGAKPWDINGPDLAFIRLPIDLTNTLRALVSFVNGEKQSEDFHSGLRPSEERWDLVIGAIDEWTGIPTQEDGKVITPFKMLVNSGQITESKDVNGLDVMRFEPILAPGFTPPESYEGTSGGGLWALFIKRENDTYPRVIQRRLVGVAYWQDRVGDSMHIICHGPRSIYGRLHEMILAKWSQS